MFVPCVIKLIIIVQLNLLSTRNKLSFNPKMIFNINWSKMINMDRIESGESRSRDMNSMPDASAFANPSYISSGSQRISVIIKAKVSSTKYRWLALFWIWMFFTGPYYSIYTQSTFNEVILKKIADNSAFMNNMITIWYSGIGAISSMIAGILIAKKKSYLSIIIFSWFSVVSQIFITLAGYLSESNNGWNPSYYILMLIGYSLFGVGWEGLNVWCFAMIWKWFEVQEI